MPTVESEPQLGWAGFETSVLGAVLGPIGFLGFGAGYLMPQLVGPDAFLSVVTVAAVPLGVLFGFLAQAMARIAWEETRLGERSSAGRHEVLLLIPGLVAGIALLATLVYIGCVKASPGNVLTELVARWGGGLVGGMIVVAFASVVRLPQVVKQISREPHEEPRRRGMAQRRMMARTVDALVIAVLCGVLLVVLWGIIGVDRALSPWAAVPVSVATLLVYESVTGRFGRGLGKRLFRLELCRADDAGHRPGWRSSVSRAGVLAVWWAATVLWFMIESTAVASDLGRLCLIYIVAVLTFAPSLHELHQGVHDVVGGTVVTAAHPGEVFPGPERPGRPDGDRGL